MTSLAATLRAPTLITIGANRRPIRFSSARLPNSPLGSCGHRGGGRGFPPDLGRSPQFLTPFPDVSNNRIARQSDVLPVPVHVVVHLNTQASLRSSKEHREATQCQGTRVTEKGGQ